MLTERQRLRLEHIVENAERIRGYVEGLSFEQFAASAMALDAVERCLGRITEAAIRLSDEVMPKSRQPCRHTSIAASAMP